MKTELVSVVIPTHKRPKMLERAVNSVLKQTYKNIEIIIVDDGSNDSTKNVVKELKEKNAEINIEYIANDKPMGACVARNRGIQKAKGEFITGLDDDDEFTPNRIENFVKHYSDDFSFICSDIKIIKTSSSKVLKSKKLITFNDLLWENIVGPQIFIKKNRILEVNGFNEVLPSAQDYDLWLRLVQKFGTAKNINSPLYILHTEHDAPRITTSPTKFKGYFIVYKKYKKYMTNKQKIYNLIILKMISDKYFSLSYVFSLFPSYYGFYSFYLFFKKILNYEKNKII